MTGSFERAIQIIDGMIELVTSEQARLALGVAKDRLRRAIDAEMAEFEADCAPENVCHSEFEGTQEEYNKTIMGHDL